MSAIDFIVTTFDHLPGARLSCCGKWGNVPFDSVEAAEAEARRIAGSRASVRHERPRAAKGKRK